jgi:serine/threonine-protein kinase haspin
LSTDGPQKCGSNKSRKKVYGKKKPAASSPPVPEHERHGDIEFDFLVETVQSRLQGVTLDDAVNDILGNTIKEKPDAAGGSGSGSGEISEVNTPSDGKDAEPVLDAAPESLDKPQAKQTTKQKKARSPTPYTGYVDDKTVNLYVRPILDEAVSPIAMKGVQEFAHWARGPGGCFRVDKIAEGSYGEVYQLRLRDDLSNREMSKSKLAKLKAYDAGVFKIVPLRAQRGPGSKKFTTVEEIVSEVRLLKLLDPVPGFVRFREVHVVQGRFPDTYQRAWAEYSRTKDDCFNPDPAKKSSYPDLQLWAILEMDYAGHELEKFTFSTVSQIYDMFWGVALGLARAEQLSRFEVGNYPNPGGHNVRAC